MNLRERLKRLEKAKPRIAPIFITCDDPPFNAVQFFGVQGGKIFHRQETETETDFRQRCEKFAVKYTQSGYLPIYFQIDTEGVSFF